jgi:putative ABC transport system substrate-binding protein
LPALAADLLRRQPFVMLAAAMGAIQPIRALNATIPIVFNTANDPVQAGIVASLRRPTGNITGVTNLGVEVGPKRIEVLHELVPQASSIALLDDRAASNDTIPPALMAAAMTLGLTLHPLRASNEHEIDDAFAALPKLGVGGLVVQASPVFTTRMKQLGALTLRQRVPAIYEFREFAAGGGLASYGGDLPDSYRLAGIYVGRILKGEKPADLPVQQVSKIELVINLKTAKALGITVPITLLGRADEVIE